MKHKTQQQHQQCLFDANMQLVSDNFNVNLKTPLSLFLWNGFLVLKGMLLPGKNRELGKQSRRADC